VQAIEALRIYRQLAQEERETYLPYVATTLAVSTTPAFTGSSHLPP
jgi:hypothetical protein